MEVFNKMQTLLYLIERKEYFIRIAWYNTKERHLTLSEVIFVIVYHVL